MMLNVFQGLEDHLGDMDFKIAGTRKGITAIQLDIKPAGIPLDIICESLEPARKARNQILDRMDQEISTARAINDGSAPRLGLLMHSLFFVAKPDMIKIGTDRMFTATMSFSSDSLRKLLFHRKRIEQLTGIKLSVCLLLFMFLFMVLYHNVLCQPTAYLCMLTILH
jgi:polyribonucleotide nucleotidyltransferase